MKVPPMRMNSTCARMRTNAGKLLHRSPLCWMLFRRVCWLSRTDQGGKTSARTQVQAKLREAPGSGALPAAFPWSPTSPQPHPLCNSTSSPTSSTHLVHAVAQLAQLVHARARLHVWVVARADGAHAGGLIPCVGLRRARVKIAVGEF